MSHTRMRTICFAQITLLAMCSACSYSNTFDTSNTDEANNSSPAPKMAALVSTQWLSDHLQDSDLVVLDATVVVKVDDQGNFRSISGRDEFAAGHIPSAGFADLMTDFSGTPEAQNFTLPTPEQFRAAIGALGVGNNYRVVVYSNNQTVWAASLWWMLRWAGLDQVAVLDGGLQAWKREGRPLSTASATHPERQFNLDMRPELIADSTEVFAAIDRSQTNIVDAMPDAHYRGQFSLYARPGHIPSAGSMPSSDLIDESGFYKSFDELDMMHEGDRNKRVITYCGGGIAASSVAFTMYRLGYTDVAVYMGSLQEWAAIPEYPMTTDVP